ncbi:MAG: SH3 domain-containing protein [Spirochaetaceae bacterium]|nr:MAG: SH3 domain-containing protein [Spirochaetaceae bacterium]
MKKLLLFIAVLSLFMACEKEEQQYDTAGFDFSSAGNQVIAPQAVKQGNAQIASVSARYFEETRNNQGALYYKTLGYVEAGKSVTLLGGEQKDVKSDGGSWRIAQARLEDNKVVWLSVWYVLQNQEQAVVITDPEAKVYNGLGPSDLTTYVIPRGTIIGVAPPEASGNPFNRRLFVAYQVPQRTGKVESFGTWSKYYVDSRAISTKESDFKMREELDKIKKLSPSLWADALDNVIQIYGDSAFVAEAEAMRQEAASGGGAKSVESVSFSGIITEDKVNVRAEPDEYNGTIVGQVNKGEAVQIDQQTSQTYSIGGLSGKWYRIQSAAVNGWVFGAFVKQN